jgi:hypothetical protein
LLLAVSAYTSLLPKKLVRNHCASEKVEHRREGVRSCGIRKSQEYTPVIRLNLVLSTLNTTAISAPLITGQPWHIPTVHRREVELVVTCSAGLILVMVVASLLTNSACKASGNDNDEALVKRGGAVLDDIARDTADMIPDALLNHTTCMIIVPAEARADDRGKRGLVNCRDSENNWNATETASVVLTTAVPNADLLVLIQSQSAAHALESGKLTLASTGTFPSTTSLVAPVEIRSDAIAFARANGHLAPVKLSKTMVVTDGSRKVAHGDSYVRSLTSLFNSIHPDGIVLHHTAVLPTTGAVPASMEQVDQYHRQRGFDIVCEGKEYHVGYHFLVMRDGSVKKGRPERCRGAHAPGYNSYLGISIVGDFTRGKEHSEETSPTPKQMDAIVKLCRALQRKYNIPLQHIVRHSDVAPTQCPGELFPYREIMAQTQGK